MGSGRICGTALPEVQMAYHPHDAAMSLDPRQVASTPFRNITALQDLCGYLEGYRRALSAKVFALTGKVYRDANLGDGSGLFALGYSPTKKWSEAVPTGDYLNSLQQTLGNAATALGITQPQDLSSFDLRDAGEWSSFTWVLSQELRRISTAAGIV